MVLPKPRVFIDGHEVSDGVRSAVIRRVPGEIPMVTLELYGDAQIKGDLITIDTRFKRLKAETVKGKK
jgi:hypothetical protein